MDACSVEAVSAISEHSRGFGTVNLNGLELVSIKSK